MPAVIALLLILLAGVCFALAAFSAPTGRFNPIGGGLLLLTIAVWLWPALSAAT